MKTKKEILLMNKKKMINYNEKKAMIKRFNRWIKGEFTTQAQKEQEQIKEWKEEDKKYLKYYKRDKK